MVVTVVELVVVDKVVTVVVVVVVVVVVGVEFASFLGADEVSIVKAIMVSDSLDDRVSTSPLSVSMS